MNEKLEQAIREVTEAQELEHLAISGRYSQENINKFAASAKKHRDNAEKLLEEGLKSQWPK